MDHLRDYKVIVEIFRGYLDTALTVHTFYYALTGAIAAYYLAHRGEGNFMKFSLILPFLLGLALAYIAWTGRSQALMLQGIVDEVAGSLSMSSSPPVDILRSGLVVLVILDLFTCSGLVFLFSRDLFENHKEMHMTILLIIMALVGVAGFAATWNRLKTLGKAVAHLEQIHEADGAEEIKVRRLSPSILTNAAAAGEALTLLASVTERLTILGYRDNLIINLDNQPNASVNVSKEVTIQIPPGTTRVVPSLSGFQLMFGSITQNPDGSSGVWNATDHHLGLEALDVFVVKVESATATIGVVGYLSDKNGDDKWTGLVYASLLFLGPQP